MLKTFLLAGKKSLFPYSFPNRPSQSSYILHSDWSIGAQVCVFNLIAAAQESLQEYNASAESEASKPVSLWDEMQQVTYLAVIACKHRPCFD